MGSRWTSGSQVRFPGSGFTEDKPSTEENVPQRDIDVFVNSEDQSIVYYEDLRKAKARLDS